MLLPILGSNGGQNYCVDIQYLSADADLDLKNNVPDPDVSRPIRDESRSLKGNLYNFGI